ncbi:MAG TPA: hypothetical protein VGJ63_16270 [Micromonosporaceae bacterium]|jgi:hypothetical protein
MNQVSLETVTQGYVHVLYRRRMTAVVQPGPERSGVSLLDRAESRALGVRGLMVPSPVRTAAHATTSATATGVLAVVTTAIAIRRRRATPHHHGMT